jgi:hypothetical protein
MEAITRPNPNPDPNPSSSLNSVDKGPHSKDRNNSNNDDDIKNDRHNVSTGGSTYKTNHADKIISNVINTTEMASKNFSVDNIDRNYDGIRSHVFDLGRSSDIMNNGSNPNPNSNSNPQSNPSSNSNPNITNNGSQSSITNSIDASFKIHNNRLGLGLGLGLILRLRYDSNELGSNPNSNLNSNRKQ